eukprot:6069659-Prymnesium_polylepis.2
MPTSWRYMMAFRLFFSLVSLCQPPPGEEPRLKISEVATCFRNRSCRLRFRYSLTVHSRKWSLRKCAERLVYISLRATRIKWPCASYPEQPLRLKSRSRLAASATSGSVAHGRK